MLRFILNHHLYLSIIKDGFKGQNILRIIDYYDVFEFL